MAYENKPNTGALFPNEKKTSDNQPSARGPLYLQCPHCGKEYEQEQSAWTKVSKGGKRYMSVSVKEPFKKDDKPSPMPTNDPDDSLPF